MNRERVLSDGFAITFFGNNRKATCLGYYHRNLPWLSSIGFAFFRRSYCFFCVQHRRKRHGNGASPHDRSPAFYEVNAF